MHRAMILQRDVGEPSPFQQAPELVGVAKSQTGMALRQYGWLRGTDFRRRIPDQALHALLVRRVPPGEGDAPARLQRTHALRNGRLGVGKMPETEGAHDGLGRTIRERQGIHLSHAEAVAGSDRLIQLWLDDPGVCAGGLTTEEEGAGPSSVTPLWGEVSAVVEHNFSVGFGDHGKAGGYYCNFYFPPPRLIIR